MLDNENILEPVVAQESTRLNLPDGVPPLTSLYLYIAGSCNLACRHCWIVPNYLPDGTVGGLFAKLEHVEKAIREAKPLGLRTVKLTGGEPTLNPQFREIVGLIHDAGLDIIIETNGILIDDSMALFLKQNNVSFISVSLDGATAQTHEFLRSVPGSYELALKGIRSLIKAGLKPQVICTLHQGNLHEMVAVVTLANQLGCGSVKFNHVQSIGRGENFSEQQGLSVDEILQLYRQLEKEVIPNSHIPVLFDIPYAFLSLRKLVNDPLGRCSVQNILGMLAGGELSLCGIGTTVPELMYGHIAHDDIREVWCNAPGLAQLREMIPSQIEGICSKCIHLDYCQGECVAGNFSISGRLNAPFSFCEKAEVLGLFPDSRRLL
jgi:SynChlorMet cassette radical SAM/SPASM protein ScmF